MVTKTFMGFMYDDDASTIGGLVDGGRGTDLGFGPGKTAPIQPVRDIYRLEYLTTQLARRIAAAEQTGRGAPVRTRVKLTDLRLSLVALLDAEGPRLAFAMHVWSHRFVDPFVVRVQQNRKRDLKLIGDVEKIAIEAVKTGKLPNGRYIPSSIFVGAVLPNGKAISATHVRHLDAAGFGNVWGWVHRMSPAEADRRIRDHINHEYLEPEFDKTVQGFINSIAAVQAATTLEEKVVAFHQALTTAHYSGFIANNVYGQGSVEELTRLSNMDTRAWDAEVEQLMR